MALPVVYLSGTPYEQGVQHGRALRDQIARNLAVYFERFEREVRLSRPEVLRRARDYAAAIAGQSPGYHAGMQGVAAGAGFDPDEIAALNVRYELFYDQFGRIALGDGCTAFAALPEVTAGGHLLLGENWDWIAHIKGAVLHTTDPHGLRTLSFSEAGIVGGKIGLNSHGLGLAINGLTSSDDDWSRLSKPFHVRCYEILRSRDFESAVRVVTATDRPCSANFLIAQAPGRVVNIEAAPHSVGLTSCVDGCLVHSNHFVDPGSLGITEPPVEKTPHSYHRHERLRALLQSRRPLTVETIQSFLADHQGHPYSVCFHIDPAEPPEEHYLSLTSVVIDLHRQEMFITDGPPCTNPYALVGLETDGASRSSAE